MIFCFICIQFSLEEAEACTITITKFKVAMVAGSALQLVVCQRIV